MLSAPILGFGWLAGGVTAFSVLAVVVGIAAIVSVLRNPTSREERKPFGWS